MTLGYSNKTTPSARKDIIVSDFKTKSRLQVNVFVDLSGCTCEGDSNYMLLRVQCLKCRPESLYTPVRVISSLRHEVAHCHKQIPYRCCINLLDTVHEFQVARVFNYMLVQFLVAGP